jgi:protein-tyrosine phosphatase
LAIETVAQLLRANITTLVACSAGMSRSPCIAAAALSRVTGQPPNQALVQCVGGAAADVSPLLWHDVCAALVAE